MWIGLCKQEAAEDVKRALYHIDPCAQLTFASSPRDIRERVQQSPFGVGAIVGPLDGAMSPINVAAALVRDGLAADVALVVSRLTKGVSQRAERAGIRTVIDATHLADSSLPELDEPAFAQDELPTMMLSTPLATSAMLRLPRIDTEKDQMPRVPFLQARPDPHVRHEEESVPRLVTVEDACEPIPYEPVREIEDNTPVVAENSTPVAVKGDAPIITFVSGRGGVGKSALVAMMALVAESWGTNVALCDLDLSCGNLYSCFGAAGLSDLASVFEANDASVDDILNAGMRVGKSISLWGPCERPEMAEVVYPNAQALLSTLSQRYDLVLVDTTTTFTDAVAQAAQQSDRLVITVDDRPGSAVSQAKVAALAVRLGVARTRIVRLANRCGPHGRGEPIINRADVGLETARPMRVLDGGPEVGECMAEGRMGDLLDLGSRFAESTATTLATLLSELGKLPDHADAQRALERHNQKPRWSFGKRREAM